MKHLNDNNILVHYQHGFRSGHSCETQLLTTIEDISRTLDMRKQVDMMILDFSKAFDTVPHRKLLMKLDHYGIRDHTHEWIRQWLTTRKQRVVLDGEASSEVHVDSGVPQGTVLGPLMFLLYVNDIGEGVNSEVKLFADDCLLYRTIESESDTKQLQEDLSKMTEWSKKWLMRFNAKKCHVMRLKRSRQNIVSINNYNIDGSTLEEVEHHPYLGVELGNDLNQNHHIDQTTTKAIGILAFLRRNLNKCSKEVEEKAYTTLIRPNLEYGSSVWDPFRQYQIDAVEMVQRRAARFVTGQYNRYQSVTSMLQELKWTSLQQRQEQRLVNLYKCVNNINALQTPLYVVRPTRGQNSNRFIPISCNNDSYKYSYFPMTLLEWNNLPERVVRQKTVETFKTLLHSFIEE